MLKIATMTRSVFYIMLTVSFFCYSRAELDANAITSLLSLINGNLDKDNNMTTNDRNSILTSWRQIEKKISVTTETYGSDIPTTTPVTQMYKSRHTGTTDISVFNLQILKALNEEKRLNKRLRRQVVEFDRSVKDCNTTYVLSEFVALKKFITEKVSQKLDKLNYSIMLVNEDFKKEIVAAQINPTAVLQNNDDESTGTETTIACTESPSSELEEYPTDCSSFMYKPSGVYKIYPKLFSNGVKVYCDMDTDGGNWTVFQRRKDGTVNFQRSWEEYREGFGDLSGEFWLGNKYIHAFTTQHPTELRVDLVYKKGNVGYAKYEHFKVDPEDNGFPLTVGGYSGNIVDSLDYHNNMKFTTKDRDNDKVPRSNCAVKYSGPWWHKSCYDSNLNGDYFRIGDGRGIIWHYSNKVIQFTEMKMRW